MVKSRKKIIIRRNNQDGFFFTPFRIQSLPYIIKIDYTYNFPRKKKEIGAGSPIVVPADIKNLSTVAVKW